MKENKKKWAYWMTPSMVDEIQKMVDEDYAKSKSDFVCDAVDFYLNYLKTQESLDFISPLLATAVRNELSGFEKNVCEMLFKVAVENAKQSYLLASINEFTDEDYEKIQKICCEEVAFTNGVVTFTTD
jgi:Arc/MetJ-type ribon-helix-helix transcriptional regulator